MELGSCHQFQNGKKSSGYLNVSSWLVMSWHFPVLTNNWMCCGLKKFGCRHPGGDPAGEETLEGVLVLVGRGLIFFLGAGLDLVWKNTVKFSVLSSAHPKSRTKFQCLMLWKRGDVHKTGRKHCQDTDLDWPKGYSTPEDIIPRIKVGELTGSGCSGTAWESVSGWWKWYWASLVSPGFCHSPFHCYDYYYQ